MARIRTSLPAALAAVLVLTTPLVAQEPVRVWEGTFPLPTYEEDLPDPNPPFSYFRRGRINYPYTIRDNLTDRRTVREWRALFLENEYLKCVVLPDLGGHLYSCTDKVSGEEMFYANTSIKLTQIGYRGAWAAFGVEFNFPVSHNWMTTSPVDFATSRGSDGSASVWVGNTDRVTGMRWLVELTLRPGRAALEQRTTLYNRSPFRHRFYWWTNAAVRVWDDSRIVYPQRWTASHGHRDVDTWPVNSRGVDLSVVGNHLYGPVSRFAYGSREPFMAVWHPRTGTGVVHYSDPTDLPAKKIWSFGGDPSGLNWRRALSDDESAYVEIQAGLFRDQETYAFLEPQERIVFRETWLPVRGLGGITRATRDAVAYLERTEEGELRVALNVAEAYPGARVLVRAGDRTLLDRRVDLAPPVAFVDTVADAAAPASLEVRDADGVVILSHTEDVWDFLPEEEVRVGPVEPHTLPADEEAWTPADFEAAADELERNGLLLDALETWRRGLERYPEALPLARGAGRLSVILKRPQEAVEPLEGVVERVSNDAEAWYYLGHARAALGDEAGARLAWERAQAFGTFRPAALLELAGLAARSGDRATALHLLREGTAYDPEVPWTARVRLGALRVALLRAEGRGGEARRELDRWLALDPASSFLRHERMLLGEGGAADADGVRAAGDGTAGALGADPVGTGGPGSAVAAGAGAERRNADGAADLWTHLAGNPERILELVVDYMKVGLYEDALALLRREYPRGEDVVTEPGMPHPSGYPLLAYYEGYLQERLGRDPTEAYTRASRLPTTYVFPNRHETEAALRSALRADPDDATAHFLLGSLLLSGGRAREAMAEWEEARRLRPSIPTLHRNMGWTVLAGAGRGTPPSPGPREATPSGDRVRAAAAPVTGEDRVRAAAARAAALFTEGTRYDGLNPDLYLGRDSALALLGRSPSERADSLLRFPEPALLPPKLVYRAARLLAVAGRFDEAEGLFRNRFFPSEEGGTDVRLVWLEVRTARAEALARSGRCREAVRILDGLPRPVVGLPFTEEPMDWLLRRPPLAGRVAAAWALCPLGSVDGIPYRVGVWDPDTLGAHRVVVRVGKDAVAPAPAAGGSRGRGDGGAERVGGTERAVAVRIPWRRRDPEPARKHLVVVDAATRRAVANVARVAVSRAEARLAFEPVSGPGTYLVYYLPHTSAAGRNYPRVAYPEPRSTADPAWLARYALADAPAGDPEAASAGEEALAAWARLPRATVEAFEAASLLDSFWPMEITATGAEVRELRERAGSAPFLLFPEDRSRSIRMRRYLPLKWIQDGPERPLEGEAARGEFWSFQVGVWALEALDSLQARVSDFVRVDGPGGGAAAGSCGAGVCDRTAAAGSCGPGACDGTAVASPAGPGDRIPASAVHAFNLRGVDSHGRPFEKRVDVPAGEVQPLWFGVPVPEDAVPGIYEARVAVGAADRPFREVTVRLRVGEEEIRSHGDDDPARLTRLRWLDSRIRLDDELVAPFTPVEDRGRVLSVLGREVELDDSGFPARIRSYFTPEMTSVGEEAREVLAAPVAFVAVDASGAALPWRHGGPEVVRRAPGVVEWRARSTTDGLVTALTGTLEFDGTMEFRVELNATRDVELGDVYLDIPVALDVARYMMGMGYRGGLRPASFDWTWKVEHNQDGAWIGDVNAGLQFLLRDEAYVRPLNTNFYLRKPLVMPRSWENGGRGGCRMRELPAPEGGAAGDTHGGAHPGVRQGLPAVGGRVAARSSRPAAAQGPPGTGGRPAFLVRCYSGPRRMAAGETLRYDVRLTVTPFKPLDTAAHFGTRYYHRYESLDSIQSTGANTVNVHHATPINPWINYPFLTPDLMKAYIDEAHRRGMRVKFYYTVRELSTRAPELFMLFSLGDEVFARGPGGGFSWLQEHLDGDYIAGWFVPRIQDAAVVTSGVSRWHNYYLEGLDWLVRNLDIDGLYIDDVAFDRETMKRVRKILDQDGRHRLIDLHSANQFNVRDGFANSANLYLEHFPFIDRLWFGEYFDYDSPPDFWMTELAGIPFGLMGEMLQDGGNPWRGMVFGMTARLPWAGDPTPLWRVWDEFGIVESRMVGWWVPDRPVRTGRDDVLATTYLREGRALVALASWAEGDVEVRPEIDWEALGIEPGRAVLRAPAIRDFQEAATFRPGEAIPVPEGRGWLLWVEEAPRNR